MTTTVTVVEIKLAPVLKPLWHLKDKAVNVIKSMPNFHLNQVNLLTGQLLPLIVDQRHELPVLAVVVDRLRAPRVWLLG